MALNPQKFSGIRAITLDLDDTLWPVQPVLEQANRAVVDWLAPRAPRTAAIFRDGCELFSLKALFPEHAHDMSWLRREKFRQVLQEQGEDLALVEPAFQVFYEGRQQVRPYADAAAVLALWAEQYSIAAITNGNADVFRTPLGKYFDVVIAAGSFGAAKPDPRVFLAACEKLGVLPQDTLHIGDDLTLDVEAALHAGLQAAWIKRPELHSGQSDATADIQVQTRNHFGNLWQIHEKLQQSIRVM